MSETSSWPAARRTRHYDPEVTRRLEALTAAPMDTLKHDAEQAAIRGRAGVSGRATLTGLLEFKGRTFRFGSCDALAAVLDFAEAAERGLDARRIPKAWPRSSR